MRWYEAGLQSRAGGPDGREQGRRWILGRGKILCRSLEIVGSHSFGIRLPNNEMEVVWQEKL